MGFEPDLYNIIIVYSKIILQRSANRGKLIKNQSRA